MLCIPCVLFPARGVKRLLYLTWPAATVDSIEAEKWLTCSRNYKRKSERKKKSRALAQRSQATRVALVPLADHFDLRLFTVILIYSY